MVCMVLAKAGGVITDIDGNFTIEVGESDVLQITFIQTARAVTEML